MRRVVVLDYQAALSAIARGKTPAVYLLHGSRAFAMEIVEALRKAHVSPELEGLNFTPVDGAESKAGDVVSLAMAAPIGSGKRLVFVTDPAWLRTQRVDPAVASYLRNPPDSSILVFYQEEKPAAQVVKLIEASGEIVDCSGRRDSVAGLVKARAREAGKDVTPGAVWAICGMMADNPDFAESEIEKVIRYAGDDGVIDTGHVEAVGFGHSETTVFDLVNAIVAGDVDRSMALAKSLSLRNEDPHRIMQTLSWQFRTMYRMKFLLRRGMSAEEAAREAGVKPFQLKRLVPQARRMPFEAIASSMEAILETGMAVNSGLLDESLAIETLIVRLRRCLAAPGDRPTSKIRR